MLSVAGAVGALVVLTGLGNSVVGAAWSLAMRGSDLLLLAEGGVASLDAATGLAAGAAPGTGLFC